MNNKGKVVLNLFGLSVPDKVQKARNFITSIKGNDKLKEPSPLLEQIDNQAQALEDAYTDAQQSRTDSVTKTAVMAQQEQELDNLLKLLALYVEGESKGDEAIIKSAGMSVKKTRTPAGIPLMPEALAAAEGKESKSIALKWKPVKGSRTYFIRATATIGDANSWQQVAASTKATVTVTGLKSGEQYWFQVCALGSAGQGPWSDPATKIVP